MSCEGKCPTLSRPPEPNIGLGTYSDNIYSDNPNIRYVTYIALCEVMKTCSRYLCSSSAMTELSYTLKMIRLTGN